MCSLFFAALTVERYYCSDVEIDVNTQSAVGCVGGLVNVTCFVAPNLNVCSTESDDNFTRQMPCRDV